MPPKVSVIIPCYNLGQYLNEAVDSVLAQTFQDYEIIIVNDGSTDEFTNNLLKDFKKPNCTVYITPNQGLPAARNYGIERSKGEYICCLDADDKYHSEFLEQCVNVLDADSSSEFGFVTTWVTIFGDEEFTWETADFNPCQLVIENQIHVASLFRKSVWEEVNGYSTNLAGYQDWDFWLKIAARGYKWHVIKTPLFFYRKRSDSMIKTSDVKRSELRKIIIENNLEFIKKNAVEIILGYDRLIAMLVEKQDRCTRYSWSLEKKLAILEPVVNELEPFANELRPYANELKPIAGNLEPNTNELETVMQALKKLNNSVLFRGYKLMLTTSNKLTGLIRKKKIREK
jgi:glycosyltransferase involved in cell wall biosynthesis